MSQGILDVIKKQEFWKQFCEEQNGNFKLKRTHDKVYNKIEMSIQYNNSTLHFNESDRHPLKIDCDIKDLNSFSFQITSENLVDKIFKFLTNSKIKIGDKEFDNLYLIETNNKAKLLKLLSNIRLRRLLVDYGISNYQIRQHKRQHKLFLLGGRQINTKEQLNDIFEILKITIDNIK